MWANEAEWTDQNGAPYTFNWFDLVRIEKLIREALDIPLPQIEVPHFRYGRNKQGGVGQQRAVRVHDLSRTRRLADLDNLLLDLEEFGANVQAVVRRANDRGEVVGYEPDLDDGVVLNAAPLHELIPWRTLTGRQQLYQDHPWMRAFGEGFTLYKPPIDTHTVTPVIDRHDNSNAQLVLNFITPHQKWGIHSTYSDNLLMLTLSRGGPIVWISEEDARRVGIRDNDWIEAYNVNGALTARAVVSQRVPSGMCLMYHAQEKIVNVPGSEITGNRGGIHNSVTRTVTKPTHMIGGYAQQSYGFNYYGTVGANRDEFVIVRKMTRVDWLDEPADTAVAAE